MLNDGTGWLEIGNWELGMNGWRAMENGQWKMENEWHDAVGATLCGRPPKAFPSGEGGSSEAGDG